MGEAEFVYGLLDGLSNTEFKDTIDKFKQGYTIADIRGFSSDQLENIYALAFGFYNNGNYAEALPLMRTLALMNSYEKKYVIGLAGCLQMTGKYQDAIEAYSIAVMVDIKDPEPLYHIGTCLLKQSKKSEAFEIFTQCHAMTEGVDEYKDINSKSQKYIDLLT
jgi:type III secretion system low calcium response chaperone LcrH/SycD